MVSYRLEPPETLHGPPVGACRVRGVCLQAPAVEPPETQYSVNLASSYAAQQWPLITCTLLSSNLISNIIHDGIITYTHHLQKRQTPPGHVKGLDPFLRAPLPDMKSLGPHSTCNGLMWSDRTYDNLVSEVSHLEVSLHHGVQTTI